MQKVVEFKRLSFWSSSVDLEQLNQKIAHYNEAGWRVVNATPQVTIFGSTRAYSLLIERDDE